MFKILKDGTVCVKYKNLNDENKAKDGNVLEKRKEAKYEKNSIRQ
jgi:hypothetical protein